MSTEYSNPMSEDSGEQSPHKFSRVSDIKTARHNFADRKREERIEEHQEALRRINPGQMESTVANLADEQKPVNKHMLQVGMVKAITEVAGEFGADIFTDTKALIKLHEKIAPLITSETNLDDMYLPNFETVKNEPNYDIETINTYKKLDLVKGRHGRGLRVLTRAGVKTVGDMQARPLSELREYKNGGLKTMIYLKTVYAPLS